ncbi:hypothetical protein [Congregicoccus parvus]|uniref:hypothetical protein n=1 Tax=Congregicoccus parvus TaxID=3081749 RepID=UPI003FA585AA
MDTKSFSRRRRSASSRKSGFALVLAVVLLALVVLVLVMLASLTRVETSIAGNTRKFSQARQNALFGLEKAIANIQEHAGPDQRVTATAGLVGGTDSTKRFWTGVWDTTSGSAQPSAWLVSGTTPVATGQAPANNPGWIEIVGRKSVDSDPEVVRVEAEDIIGTAPDGAADARLGRFAYWVGDEGVKARVNLHDAFHGASSSELEKRISRHQAPQRSGLKLLSDFGGITLNDTNYELERVTHPFQLKYIAGGADSIDDIRRKFHTITTSSRGVIADTVTGGLKTDLTPYFYHGDEARAGFSAEDVVTGVKFGELRNWWVEGLGVSGFGDTSAGYVDRRFPDIDPYEEAARVPILTRMSMFVGASEVVVIPPSPGVPGQSRLRAHLVPVFAIWNPYNVGLNAATYRIRADWNTGFQFTLNSSGSRTTEVPIGGPLWFKVQNLELKPGECRILSAAEWAPYDVAGENLLAPGWFEANAFYFDPVTPIAFQTDGSDSTVRMHERDGATFGHTYLYLGDTSNDPVQVLPGGSVGYSPRWGYERQESWPTGGNPNPLLKVSTDDAPPTPVLDRGMVAHGTQLTPANWKYWDDITHDTFDRDFSYVGADADVKYQQLQIQFGRDPSDPPYFFGYVGMNWNRPDSGNPVFGQRYATLFEIPREDVPILSIGRLQHVRRTISDWNSANPPTFIHRPLFDQVPLLESALWDGYFFSTVPDRRVPAVPEPPEPPEPPVPLTSRLPIASEDLGNHFYRLPNSRIRFYRPAGQPPPLSDLRLSAGGDPMTRSAAHLLIHGAFNVNSVSQEAWKAVLGSHLGVEVDKGYPTPSQDIGDGVAVSRFSHPMQGLFDGPPASGTLLDGGSGLSHPAGSIRDEAWAGGRRLSASEVDSLATRISNGVAAHGVFFSLAEFVESRVIQNAINNAGLNAQIRPSAPGGSSPSHEMQLPGVITQRDIMQTLGSIFTVRSDTFLIRAYGEAVNPVTGLPEGKAWCEAVVQRTPEYVDPNLNEPWQDPTGINQQLGRRFEIVSFRWLTPADL